MAKDQTSAKTKYFISQQATIANKGCDLLQCAYTLSDLVEKLQKYYGTGNPNMIVIHCNGAPISEKDILKEWVGEQFAKHSIVSDDILGGAEWRKNHPMDYDQFEREGAKFKGTLALVRITNEPADDS